MKLSDACEDVTVIVKAMGTGEVRENYIVPGLRSTMPERDSAT